MTELNEAWDNHELGADEAHVRVSTLDPETVTNALKEPGHD